MTDEEMLDAFLDGEMEPADRAAFEARVAADPALRAGLEARRSLDADLKDAYAHARGSHRGEPSSNFRLPAPKRRVPWILLPLATAAGIGAGLLLRPPPAEPINMGGLGPQPVVAFLTQSTGARRAGTVLRAGDVVVTDPGERTALVLSDGTEVRLDRGTRVHLPGGRAMDVGAGRVWSHVTPGSPFHIGMDGGRTNVTVLGTELSVSFTPKSTSVQLFSGKARVQSGEETRDLEPGQEAEVAGGKISDIRRIGSEAIATGWMLELVAHSGGHDRELAEHLDRLLVDMGHTKAAMIPERELVKDLAGSCRIPLARYLASDGARLDLEPRRKAARVLERIADRSVAGELAGALRDPDPEVRVSAARALNRVSGGKVCARPDEFQASCDDGQCSLAEAWAKAGGDQR